MKKPASSITVAAPPRLASTLAAVGYRVDLVVTRVGEYGPDAPDPGADPGPIDAPITTDDRARLLATLAAYDVVDVPPAGPRFKAPRK